MSELEAHSELQLAGIRAAIFTCARTDRPRRLDIAAGSAIVDVIEEIECIHAELSNHRFVNREVLLHGKVRVEEVWSKDSVSPNISNLAQSRSCINLSQWLGIKEA